MYRRIHSDRDPRDTITRELHKEFRPYMEKAAGALRAYAARNPKSLYYGMVLTMFISLILSFFVFRKKRDSGQGSAKIIAAPITKSLDQILQTSRKISLGLILKKNIDSLSSLKKLDAADSVQLDSDLDRLQALNKGFIFGQIGHAHQQLPLKINK